MATPPWLPDTPLFDHQKRIIRRIVELNGVCAIFAEPGTGKSLTALVYSAMLAHASHAKARREGVDPRPVRVLVIAPPAALYGWVLQAAQYLAGVDVWAEAAGGSIAQRAESLRERRKHSLVGARRATALYAALGGTQVPPTGFWRRQAGGGRPAVTLMVVSTTSLGSRHQVTRSRTNADVMLDAVKIHAPDLIVFDESHQLRGRSSNTGRLARRIAPNIPRRLLLTGTPMPTGPMDLWGQFMVLDPTVFASTVRGEVKSWSFSSFQSKYAEMGGWMGKQVTGYRMLDDLNERTATRSIAVSKADALDLPPVRDISVPVKLSVREQAAYAAMKRDLVAAMDDGRLVAAPNRLTQMMRLRQLTSGFLNDTQQGTTDVLGSSKSDAAVDLITSTLAGETRVVVFAHFRREVDGVAAKLAKAKHDRPTTVEVISGDTSTTHRQEIRNRFGDRAKHPERIVLVCQVRTVSLAINELVTAQHAVYLSLSERREDIVQSRDRLDRLGQTGDSVTFWTLAVPGTVDEVILKAHAERTSLEEALMLHLKDRG